jgi:cytochrome P450
MLRRPHLALADLQRRYGDVVAFGAGPFRYVCLFGADANRLLLADRPELFLWGPALRTLIPVDGPTALVVTDGEEHRTRRRLVQPAFATRRIDAYVPGMVDEVDRTIDGLPVGGTVELYATLRRTVRRIVVRALFGDSFRERADELGDVLEPALRFVDRAPQLQLAFAPAAARARRSRAAAARIVDEEAAKPDAAGVLAVLVDSGLSQEEIRDQVVSLIAAGYDTASAAVTWVLYELLRDPTRWAAARDGVVGRLRDAPPTADDLQALPHLDAVVHEAQRLWPAAPFSGRHAVEPFTFQGHEIPARTMVIYSPWVTHRLPSLWDRPDEFLPERWLGSEPPAYAYVPFGGGHRRCIGFGLALTEIKVAVVRLLQRASLRLRSTDVEAGGVSALRPVGGLAVDVVRRA